MHIIKITPVSFKIILTKEDLQRHGIEHISSYSGYDGFDGDFFAEIIEKTNTLYGCPFKEGAVDAEFFESKDGGGELFICRARHIGKTVIYLFEAENSENLFLLCNKLKNTGTTNDSRLYFYNGKYSLLLLFEEKNDFVLSILKEFGNAEKISKLQMWVVEEHASIILEENAIETITEYFT